MNFNFKEIISTAMILFGVIDIIGSLPIIISLREKAGKIESGKATLVSLVIMILFVFIGEGILRLFGVDVYSFAVAGSVILFIMAMEMVLGVDLFKQESTDAGTIFPLAFPLIAGAASLTTILSLQAEYATENIIVGIIVNMVIVFVVLKSSTFLSRVLGSGGINIIRRVFGVVLLAIAVKLFTQNIQSLF